LVAGLSTGVQTLLENVSAGIVSKSIASKGGYKYLRDQIIGRLGNKAWSRAAGTTVATTVQTLKEAGVERGQEMVAIAGEQLGASDSAQNFYKNLEEELQTKDAQTRLNESTVGGLFGAGGLIVGGKAIFGEGKYEPPTQLGGIKTEPVAEDAPAFKPEQPSEEQHTQAEPADSLAPPIPGHAPNGQSDEQILAGQKASGIEYQGPIAELPQEAKNIIQSASQGKLISLKSARDLMEGLYNEYKIYSKLPESTSRNLTLDQIAEGKAQYEEALSVLGDYISSRDGGDFMQEFAAKFQQPEVETRTFTEVPGGEWDTETEESSTLAAEDAPIETATEPEPDNTPSVDPPLEGEPSGEPDVSELPIEEKPSESDGDERVEKPVEEVVPIPKKKKSTSRTESKFSPAQREQMRKADVFTPEGIVRKALMNGMILETTSLAKETVGLRKGKVPSDITRGLFGRVSKDGLAFDKAVHSLWEQAQEQGLNIDDTQIREALINVAMEGRGNWYDNHFNSISLSIFLPFPF